MIRLPTKSDREILVDDEDAEIAFGFSWSLSGSGNRYARTSFKHQGKRIKLYMHRLLLRAPADMQVHHVNENTLDNRRCNLMLVTPRENVRVHFHARQTGAHRLPDGRWRARSRINGIQHSLGIFDDRETALRVSNVARDLMHGLNDDEARNVAAQLRYKGGMHGRGFDETLVRQSVPGPFPTPLRGD